MFQVRIHGRGGQGVVSGAEMLSIAAFLQGSYAQAFPSFGSERTGAPVVPIGIGGSDRIMPKGAHLPRPAKVHIEVGLPIEAPARSERGRVPRTQVHEFTLRLAAQIQRLYDQAQGEVGR